MSKLGSRVPQGRLQEVDTFPTLCLLLAAFWFAFTSSPEGCSLLPLEH